MKSTQENLREDSSVDSYQDQVVERNKFDTMFCHLSLEDDSMLFPIHIQYVYTNHQRIEIE